MSGATEKLCVHCVHHTPSIAVDPSGEYSRCSRYLREPERRSLVTGAVSPAKRGFCDLLRADGGACGPGARGFEGRRP